MFFPNIPKAQVLSALASNIPIKTPPVRIPGLGSSVNIRSAITQIAMDPTKAGLTAAGSRELAYALGIGKLPTNKAELLNTLNMEATRQAAGLLTGALGPLSRVPGLSNLAMSLLLSGGLRTKPRRPKKSELIPFAKNAMPSQIRTIIQLSKLAKIPHIPKFLSGLF